jgi:hypothetical protein
MIGHRMRFGKIPIWSVVLIETSMPCIATTFHAQLFYTSMRSPLCGIPIYKKVRCSSGVELPHSFGTPSQLRAGRQEESPADTAKFMVHK